MSLTLETPQTEAESAGALLFRMTPEERCVVFNAWWEEQGRHFPNDTQKQFLQADYAQFVTERALSRS